MNFLNLSDIRKHLGTLEREYVENNASYFNKVSFNHFDMEFYAGNGALSEPHVDLGNLTYYKKLQLSLYENIRDQAHAISPGMDDRFSGFDWAKYFVYYNSKGIQKTSYMGDRIPMSEVCQLIRDVYKVSRLKIFF
jgi:hypothetical protein